MSYSRATCTLVLFIFLAFISVFANSESLTKGRVVDSATSRSLAGVFVVALWKHSDPNLGRICRRRLVTYTDGNGSFQFSNRESDRSG